MPNNHTNSEVILLYLQQDNTVFFANNDLMI